MDLRNDQGLAKLATLFRDNSLKLLQNDLSDQAVQIDSCDRHALAYYQQLSLMLINHAAFTARYSLHFMIKDVVTVLAHKYRIAAATIPKERAIDYCKEFCNIVVGSVVNGLMEQKQYAVHSLPFAMQGYNDIFFNDQEADARHDAYFLSADRIRIGLSIDFQVSNREGLKALQEVDTARITQNAFAGSFDIL